MQAGNLMSHGLASVGCAYELSRQINMSLFSFAHAAKCETKDWTRSRFASFRDDVPQKSAAYALTRVGSRLCCRISRQSWSRKRGRPLLERLVGCFADPS